MSKRRPSGRVTMTPVDWMDLVAKSFSDLRTTIQSRNANDGAGFSASYAAIKEVNYMAPATVSQLPDNKDKNRYKNVLAYDATRVVLQPAKKKGPDYVNANWIPGKDGSQDYIASQGPVPASFGDFWSMVLQTGVETIVMTTREVEGGKLKCHRYWPDPTSKPMKKQLKFNDCKVTFQSSEYHEGHTIRQFLLEGKRNGKKAKREVTQICYESWPDHGVPLSSDEFLSFREKVVQLQEQQSDPKLPLLVHCSAGVGRTGTYIAIDTYMRMITEGIPADVDKICSAMRAARNYMVQTEVQYLFIWKTLADACRDMLGDAVVPGSDEAKAESAAYDLERAAERKNIRELLEANHEDMWNETAQADEIESAEAAWVAEDEYNTVKTLSPLQSRLESLNTKGIQVDLASKMETSAIVARVKEYEKEKRAKAEAEAAAKQLESIELAQKEKEQAAAGAAVEKKRRQSKDAAKFLRKMSSK